MAQIMLGYQTPAASSSHATSAPDQSPVTPVTQEPPSSSFNTTGNFNTSGNFNTAGNFNTTGNVTHHRFQEISI